LAIRVNCLCCASLTTTAPKGYCNVQCLNGYSSSTIQPIYCANSTGKVFLYFVNLHLHLHNDDSLTLFMPLLYVQDARVNSGISFKSILWWTADYCYSPSYSCMVFFFFTNILFLEHQGQRYPKALQRTRSRLYY